jgi:hypothetical protein
VRDSPNDRGCIPNIGSRGRRKRLIGGSVWLAVGVMAVAVMCLRRASPAAGAILFLPFTFAALGYFQAREHT